jgi:hypothetical protein
MVFEGRETTRDRRGATSGGRVGADRRKAARRASDKAPSPADFAKVLAEGLRDILGIPLEEDRGTAGLDDVSRPSEGRPPTRRT